GLRRHKPQQTAQPKAEKQRLIAGLELGDSTPWPPAKLTSNLVEDAGLIDTSEQRNTLLDRLASQPVNQLLLVCDGTQTPDRGIIHLILDLGAYSNDLHLTFNPSDPTQPSINKEQAPTIQTQAP